MRYRAKRSMLYTIFLIFGIIGIILGAVVANSIHNGSFTEVINFLKGINIHIDSNLINKETGIIKTFVKYGSIILIIWTMGFTSIAVYSNIIIIIINGFTYGYLMSNFFIQYSFKGITFFIILYLIQGLIFLPILFRISYISIIYSVNRYNYFSIFRGAKKYLQLDKYLVELLFSMAGIFLISFMGTYLILTQ